mgnify:CR=1 FL=1
MAEKKNAEVIGIQALGMIETYGLVASIEAADAMAKAATVDITKQVQIGAGFLTIH